MDTEVRARLTANARPFVAGMNQAAQAANQFGGAVQQARAESRALEAIFATGAVGLVLYARKSFQAAAAVSELDRTLSAVATATGKSHRELVDAANAIEAMGIEMASARQIAAKFAQNNLDLAQASRLARVAQDLAVVSQANSTATLNRLIHGIMTGNSLVLRNAGVVGMAGKAYAEYAAELGVVATALSPAQRQQAIINMIMKEGEAVAGAYEEAMLEAGKVLRSYPRVLQNIQVAFGRTITHGFAPMVLSTYNLIKSFAEAVNITPKLNKATGEIEMKMGGLIEVIRGVTVIMDQFMLPLQRAADYLTTFAKSASVSEEQVRRFIAQIQPAIPVISAVATALGGMALKALAAGSPFEKFSGLLPGPIAAFGVFILTSDKVREALSELMFVVRPLFDELVQFGGGLLQVITSVSSVIVDVVVVFIDALTTLSRTMHRSREGVNDFATAVNMLGVLFLLSRTRALGFAKAIAVQAVASMVGFYRSIGGVSGALTMLRVRLLEVSAAKRTMSASTAVASVAMRGMSIASGLLTKAFGVLKWAIRGLIGATGIGLLVVGLTLAVEWFTKAWSTSQEFRDKVTDALNGVARTVVNFVNKLIDAVNWMNRLRGSATRFDRITFDGFDFGQVGEEPDWFEMPSYEDMFGGDIDDSIPDFTEDLEGMGEVATAAGEAVDHLAQAMERMAARLKQVNNTVKDFSRWADVVTNFGDEIDIALEDVAYQTRQFDEAMANSAITGDELTASFRGMASAIRQQLSSALSTARQRLQAVQQEYDQFQLRIASAIRQVIDFRDALPKQEENREFTGFVKALGDAMDVFNEPSQESFVENLLGQAEKAKVFSDRIRTLLEMGLSKEALQQVIDAGYEAGTAIADEIIAGGTTLVEGINDMYAAVDEMALETGTRGADQFFKVGLDMGRALVDAIVARIESERARIEGLIDAIAARLEAIARAEAEAASAAEAARRAREVAAGTGGGEGVPPAYLTSDAALIDLRRGVSYGSPLGEQMARARFVTRARETAEADALRDQQRREGQRFLDLAGYGREGSLVVNGDVNINSQVESDAFDTMMRTAWSYGTTG